MRIARVAVSVTLLTAASALAGPVTDTTFDRLWRKYAVGFFDKPKMGCVCFDGVNDYRLGSLVRFGSRAACYLPGFDADGALMSQSPCNGSFAPLTR
jgi:hypothetical protein